MTSAKIKLHWKQLQQIKEILGYEEARVVRRANILNCLHNGYGASEIATILNVNRNTVANVATVFLENGLESALYDDQRSGRPIDLDDRERSRIVAMVCSNPPEGHYRWTLDLIVEKVMEQSLIKGSISREQIRIVLKEHHLKPWLEKMWCIPKVTQQYVDRMEAILDVYERPISVEVPVVCIDEKPVPLIEDLRIRVPANAAGEVAKKDYEYKRNGSVNVFCAVEPKSGRYFNKVTNRRCGNDFAEFLKDIADAYPNAKKIALVLDNLSTHKLKSITTRFGEEEGLKLWNRFDHFFTPLHASWLNQAEIAIGMYSRQCLGDGRVQSIDRLKLQTDAWNSYENKKKTKINWRFTKSKARTSFGYQPIDLAHAQKLI